MAHVAEWKKEEVNELKSLIDKYDVIGFIKHSSKTAPRNEEISS